MKLSRIASHAGVAVVCLAVGILIGRSQSDQRPMVHGEEVGERLAMILRMPEPDVRARALSSFFAQVNPSNLETVEEVYKRALHEVDEVAEVFLAAWWARFDPAGAMGGRIPPSWGGNDLWTRTVIREWVRKDPEGARAAVAMLPPQPEAAKLEAFRSLIMGWFEHPDTDPDALLMVFNQVGELRPRGELVLMWLNRMLAARGVDYATEYTESMPDNKQILRIKREMLGRLAGIIVRTDPERAVAFAERNLDTEAGNKIAYYMVSRWARKDGPAAMQWALPLGGKTHHKVIERGWRSFQAADRDAAVAWIEAQPTSPELEPAYARYVSSVASTDYLRALELSEQIQDERRQRKVWQAIGRKWIAEDPVGAEAWMAQLDLPAETLKRIRMKKKL